MGILEFFSRAFGCTSLILILFTVIRSPSGILGGVIWLPKLWASSWSPVLIILGGLGMIMGWVSRDISGAITGFLGLILGIRHVIIVTRPHNHFDRSFGHGWQDRIPPDVMARLWLKRYRFIQPSSPAMPGSINVDLGKSGTTDKSLLCDIWTPPDGTKKTGLAVIYFHGGLWQACDKDFLTQPLFRRMASQGHVIMDVAYSLTPEADMDRMLGDVKQAIVWMKTHSAEYGVDPNRLVLMGVSGGAHLALLAAYFPDHPAFQANQPSADMSTRAVISMFGITDLGSFFEEYGRTNRDQPEYSDKIMDRLRPHLHDRTWMDKFLTNSRAFPPYRLANMPGGALLLVYLLGGTLKEIPEVYRQASPITHVGPHCPPTLQIFAEQDFVVHPSHGRRLHQALQKVGTTSIYIEIPDTVHGFDQYFGVSRRFAPAAQSATYDIERFLAFMV